MKEIWKSIPGFDGYHASNLGRVMSTKRKRHLILKSKPGPDGYHVINIKNNAGGNIRHVHRAVAYAFYGPPLSSGLVVNHIDGDRSNNNADNLEWCMPFQNTENAQERGAFRKANKRYNELSSIMKSEAKNRNMFLIDLLSDAIEEYINRHNIK